MANNFKKIRGKKGVTLVECVVAIAIFAIMSLLAYRGFTTGFNNIKKGEDSLEASNHATVVFAKARVNDTVTKALNKDTGVPAKNSLQSLAAGYGATLTIEDSAITLTNDNGFSQQVKGLLLTYTEGNYTFTEFLPYTKQ